MSKCPAEAAGDICTYAQVRVLLMRGGRLVPLPPPPDISNRMPSPNSDTIQRFVALGADRLPGHLGIEVVEIAPDRVTLLMPVTVRLLNPVGVVHGGAVVTLADTACGYATATTLPDGATSFTTIELKTNFLGSAKDGSLRCVATPVHLGRTTHVWDAEVVHVESGRRVALFRCTNLIIR